MCTDVSRTDVQRPDVQWPDAQWPDVRVRASAPGVVCTQAALPDDRGTQPMSSGSTLIRT